MSHVDCPGSCGPLSLAAMSRRVTEISTLPYIAVRVIQVANDPNSGVPEIKSVLEADPALSATHLAVRQFVGLRGTDQDRQSAASHRLPRRQANLQSCLDRKR